MAGVFGGVTLGLMGCLVAFWWSLERHRGGEQPGALSATGQDAGELDCVEVELVAAGSGRE